MLNVLKHVYRNVKIKKQSCLRITERKMAQFVPHSHIPYGEEGSGHYSKHHKGASTYWKAGETLVLKSLDKVSCDENSRFMLCDFGTADGGSSMYLMKEIVKALRSRYGSHLPIEIVYEDQPVNDFKSVFLRVHNLLPGTKPSFLKDFQNVFVYCCGTNFYEQCFPPESLSFGLSFIAVHWLSKNPCPIQNDVVQHGKYTTEEESKCFKEQAARDWEKFLLSRAKELKNGGRMVIASLYKDKDGQFPHKTKRILTSLLEMLGVVWKQLQKEGKITQQEFQNTNFNGYYRTAEEYSAPFRDENSLVSRAGLRLHEIETTIVKCYYHEKWLQEGRNNDQEAKLNHAKAYVNSFRPWTNGTFYLGLSSERSDEERKSLVDELYDRYTKLIAESPEDHGSDCPIIFMDIEK